MRLAIKDGGMPGDFNKQVLRIVGTPFSSAYVTMVRQGKRSNKEIHEAINVILKKKIFS